MANRYWGTFITPLVGENPITLQILGICSALAVTTSLDTALVMSGAVIFVLTFSGASISLIRHLMPRAVRIIVQITVIASLVIIVDQVLKAYAFEISLRLSVFVGLIVTNCIVLGRAEAFAMHNGVLASALDGVGNGLGYAWILIVVGALREFFGYGSLLGKQILWTSAEGGSFEPLHLMLLPPSAFFIIGCIVWFVRSRRPDQVEAAEHRIREELEEAGQ